MVETCTASDLRVSYAHQPICMHKALPTIENPAAPNLRLVSRYPSPRRISDVEASDYAGAFAYCHGAYDALSARGYSSREVKEGRGHLEKLIYGDYRLIFFLPVVLLAFAHHSGFATSVSQL